MSPIDDAMDEPTDFSADRDLWRRCLATETAEDEAERFLDLAAFADDRLADDDERSRVAARLAGDSDSAGDVAAARTIAAGGGLAAPGGRIDTIVGRAVAIADNWPRTAPVMPFGTHLAGHRAAVRAVEGLARWAGLAAAVAFAGWLGFAMGSGASLTLSQPAPVVQTGDGGFLTEIIDPSTGFLRDIGGGRRT